MEDVIFTDMSFEAASDGTTKRLNAVLVTEPIMHHTCDDLEKNSNVLYVTSTDVDEDARRQKVAIETITRDGFIGTECSR